MKNFHASSRFFPFFLVLVVFLSHPPSARASKTDPAPETVWDQLMRAQSYRELRSGSEYMDSKDYDKAIRAFSKAVLDRPAEPYGHIMLGAAYYWTGRVDRAEDEFREALKLDPKSAQAHLLMGIVYAWKGDGPGAYAEFQTAEHYAPDRADIAMNMGSMEETLAQSQEALDHFRRAVKLDAENPLYHFQLGMLYRRLGRDDEAAESLHSALQHYAEYEDAMLELGSVLERKGDQSEAEEMFRKAVRLKARDSVARLRLGRALLREGHADKAREIYRDAFHLSPADAGGGLALSVSFGGKPQAGNEPSGREASPSQKPPQSPPRQTAPEDAPPPKDPLDVLARNLQRIPLDQEAQLGIEMAILPRPKLERTPLNEAPSSLKKALEAAGKPPPSPMGVKRDFTLKGGNAQERQAQIQRILDDLHNVIAKAPPDAEVRMGMHLNFSRPTPSPAPERGDAQNAPKASYQPRRVGNDLGLWVVGTGWMALVEEVLPEPGEAPDHPDAADWWVTDGLAYAALGNSRGALASFEKALARDPKDELALMGRAVAFVEMGREEDAIASYRRVLSVNPKNRIAKDALAWLLQGPAK